MEADYVNLNEEEFRSVSEVITEFADEYDLPLGGASGRGWSRWATLQRCPYLYQIAYKKRVLDHNKVSSPALDIGSAVHAFLALQYAESFVVRWQDPLVLKNRLMEACNPQSVSEAWRLFEAYRGHYEDDYLENPIAVEYRAEAPKTGYSCRYDLLARVDDPPPGFTSGVYIVEHKTTSKFDMATLDSWDLDGEILGEVAVYYQARLDKEFGPLAGLIVNLIGKQKVIQFHRVVLSPKSLPWARHMKDIQYWDGLEKRLTHARTWPRALAGCITRYGTCDLFDHCRGLEKLGK